MPFVGLPPAAAWPWLIASVVLHLGYYIGLTEAYRTGDMGQVYPIARGSAPLMTAAMSTTFLGERLGLIGWSGIVVLVSGVFLISLRGGRDLARLDRRAVGFAFFTAVTICGYSMVDGVGARTAGNAHSYSVMLFLLDGMMMAVFALLRNGRTTDHRHEPATGRPAFIGGTLSLVAYWIAIWAMTVAPIAIVAALRETQRAVRRRHRGGFPEGAAARLAHRRRLPDRRRAGADPAALATTALTLWTRSPACPSRSTGFGIPLAQAAVVQFAGELQDRIGDRGQVPVDALEVADDVEMDRARLDRFRPAFAQPREMAVGRRRARRRASRLFPPAAGAPAPRRGSRTR